MSQEEHDDWPTFDSVFRELAPDSLTARERLAESEPAPSLDDPEVLAALEPLPEAADLHFEGETFRDSEVYDDDDGFEDEVLDLDNPAPDDFIGETDVPFSFIEEPAAEPVAADLQPPPDEQPAAVDQSVPDVSDTPSDVEDDGWVNHSPHDIAATEPIVESSPPVAPVFTESVSPPSSPEATEPPSMDLTGLVEPEEQPLAPIPMAEPELLDAEVELTTFDDAPAPPLAASEPAPLLEAPEPPAPLIESNELESNAFNTPDNEDLAPAFEPMEITEIEEQNPADLLSDFGHLETDAGAPVEAAEAEPTGVWGLIDDGSPTPPPPTEQPPPPTQQDSVSQEPAPQPPAPAAETPGTIDPGADRTLIGFDGKGDPITSDEEWGKLRPKDRPDKITFWENRPKFFGGDDRRRAKARRDNLAAREGELDELPQDLPCPACGHRSAADLRDPQDGRLHIRCDACAHIWSIAGQ